MRRLLPIVVIALLAATSARADVTITSAVSGKGGPASFEGQSKTSIKGTRMRIDSTVGGQQTSTIVDAATGQIIVLNHKNREAETYSSSKLTAELQKEQAGAEAKVSLTPNGQSRQIAGLKCDGYDFSVVMPMAMGNDTMNLAMAGPVWLAKNAPGAADYQAFYTTAIKNNVFLGANPRQVRGQGANVKGMTELYRAMAAAGLPYAQELQTKFEGTGPMIGMMNKMGSMTMTSTVTAISVDPIGDDMFAVPAGYATKAR